VSTALDDFSPRIGAVAHGLYRDNRIDAEPLRYHRSHGQFMDGPGSYTLHRPDHWLPSLRGASLAVGTGQGSRSRE